MVKSSCLLVTRAVTPGLALHLICIILYSQGLKFRYFTAFLDYVQSNKSNLYWSSSLQTERRCTPGRERIVPAYGGYLKNVIIVALVRG